MAFHMLADDRLPIEQQPFSMSNQRRKRQDRGK